MGPWYEKNCDLFNYFILKGIKFLKDGGRLGYIVPQYLATRTGCSIPRTAMLENGRVDFYADFGAFTVFDTAQGHHSCVFVYQQKAPFDRKVTGVLIDDAVVKKLEEKAESVASRTVERKNKKAFKKAAREIELKLMADHLAQRKEENYVLTRIGNKFSVNTPVIGGVVEAIVNEGVVPLLDPDNISNGVQTYPDKIKDENDVTRGVFVLSNKEASEFRSEASTEEKALLRDFFWPSDFEPYCGSKDQSSDKVFYITTKMLPEVEAKQSYSRVRKHLKRFSGHITSSNAPYGLHRAREEKFFSGGHRLISPRKTQSPNFFHTEKDCFVDESSNCLVFPQRADALGAMAILNSSIAHIFFYAMKRQGTQLQIDKEVIEAFKVPKAFSAKEKIMVIEGSSGLKSGERDGWVDLFSSLGEALEKEAKSKRVAKTGVTFSRARRSLDRYQLF